MTMAAASGSVFGIGIEPHAAIDERRNLRRRCGSITATFFGIEAEPQPAFEHGAAHLAGADQHQRPENLPRSGFSAAADIGEALIAAIHRRHGESDHASPEVSNMAASIASRADLPAQTTNWNAGK